MFVPPDSPRCTLWAPIANPQMNKLKLVKGQAKGLITELNKKG